MVPHAWMPDGLVRCESQYELALGAVRYETYWNDITRVIAGWVGEIHTPARTCRWVRCGTVRNGAVSHASVAGVRGVTWQSARRHFRTKPGGQEVAPGKPSKAPVRTHPSTTIAPNTNNSMCEYVSPRSLWTRVITPGGRIYGTHQPPSHNTEGHTA